jgi:hypothetical protein
MSFLKKAYAASLAEVLWVRHKKIASKNQAGGFTLSRTHALAKVKDFYAQK